ncbi:uncharacterized protein LY79DRAFT_32969 [Colletotrichum navitas]|uniref:Uncharacterized protein n=1 Tax=Colletotrichum navitas TaxID=681940 RepID=A0AAD8Q713_9PEZI|nr:uncharacterized protein LY79DRAFT_32969 [Colletotrichum navitas]KAK1596844.1 hypothetical protein LY79DRAFT_32969 [Colletotrichum navitas]
MLIFRRFIHYNHEPSSDACEPLTHCWEIFVSKIYLHFYFHYFFLDFALMPHKFGGSGLRHMPPSACPLAHRPSPPCPFADRIASVSAPCCPLAALSPASATRYGRGRAFRRGDMTSGLTLKKNSRHFVSGPPPPPLPPPFRFPSISPRLFPFSPVPFPSILPFYRDCLFARVRDRKGAFLLTQLAVAYHD